MTASITVHFNVEVGGDGSQLTLDENPSTGLLNGAHEMNFPRALANLVAIALWIRLKAADVDDWRQMVLLRHGEVLQRHGEVAQHASDVADALALCLQHRQQALESADAAAGSAQAAAQTYQQVQQVAATAATQAANAAAQEALSLIPNLADRPGVGKILFMRA